MFSVILVEAAQFLVDFANFLRDGDGMDDTIGRTMPGIRYPSILEALLR